jgi:hypothetical protein
LGCSLPLADRLLIHLYQWWRWPLRVYHPLGKLVYRKPDEAVIMAKSARSMICRALLQGLANRQTGVVGGKWRRRAFTGG